MKQDIKYKLQAEFPHFEEACRNFPISDGVCFTYGDTYYTNHNPLPADYLVHEQCHTKQQAEIGADEWWRRFFADPKFRLEQELECYRKQLASIKDRNFRFARKLKIVDDLSSPLYGGCATKEELMVLLK